MPYDRYTLADPMPGPSDHLYFLGGLSSNNCTIPQPTNTVDGVAFAGLHLLFGPIAVIGGGPNLPGVPLPPPPPVAYTGTVTTAGSFTVGTLEVDCGQIKQADPATVDDLDFPDAGTLTVKTTFDWTGGTLNSNTVAGTIALAPGAMGIAAPSFTNPGINGTVNLGSTLLLQGTEAVSPLPSLGSTLTVEEGTFNLNHDSNIVVDDLSNLILTPFKPTYISGVITLNGDNVTNKANDEGQIVVRAGGNAIVTAEDRGSSTLPARVRFNANVPKLTNRGTLIVKDKSQLLFAPSPNKDGDGGGLRQEADLLRPLATTVTLIEAGCAIDCEDKTYVRIGWGGLAMTELNGQNGQPLLLQPPVSISTQDATYALSIAFGAAILRSDRTVTLQLNVNGGLYCAGTINLYSFRMKLDNDLIVVTKQIEFTTQGTVNVKWFQENGESLAGEQKWYVLWSTAQNGATDPDPINRTPNFTKTNPPTDFAPDLFRTDVKDKLYIWKSP